MFARKDCLHTDNVGSMLSIATCFHTIPLATPFEENASPFSPEIDTIEYLETATNSTSSDNAKTHANIFPFIDIEMGIIDQRIYTLKK